MRLKFTEQAIFDDPKAQVDVADSEQPFAKKSKISFPNEIGIDNAVSDFRHWERKKRSRLSFLERYDHHLRLVARRNCDWFGSKTRRPNVVACLDFFDSIVVVDKLRPIVKIDQDLRVAIR